MAKVKKKIFFNLKINTKQTVKPSDSMQRKAEGKRYLLVLIISLTQSHVKATPVAYGVSRRVGSDLRGKPFPEPLAPSRETQR